MSITETAANEFSVFFESETPGDDQIRSLMQTIGDQRAQIDELKAQVCRWAEEAIVARDRVRELENHLSGEVQA